MATKLAPGAADSLKRALSWEGRAFSPGWCLYFQVTKIFLVPGVGDYDGDRSADAEDYWKAAVARGEVVKTDDPKQLVPHAMALWTGGSSDHGHAAYYIGGGKILTTDLPVRGRVGIVDAADVHRLWGLTLVGSVLVDGNGYQLVSEQRPPAVLRFVTPDAGANVRATPSTSGKIVRTIPRGTDVTVINSKTVGKRKWSQISDGWIASDLLAETDPTGRAHWIDTTRVNVRSKPTTAAPIVQTLPKGDLVRVLELTDEPVDGHTWARIGSGKWLAVEFLTPKVAA